MRKVASLIIALVSGASVVIACSSAEDKPGVTPNGDGGERYEGGARDAGGDGEGGKQLPKTCSDGKKGEEESDVDCGGKDCFTCDVGKACGTDSDCDLDAQCTNSKCVNCADNKQNGDETGVDCGGSCGGCGRDETCKVNEDCRSNVCNTTTSKCECPKDMAPASFASGTKYCIEVSEVTKAQYKPFFETALLADQPASCVTANTSFYPRAAYPASANPATSGGNSVAFNMGLPVHYVDWCDAHAYCKFVGRSLCGSNNGTKLTAADGNDATKSAWYNACSAQGTKPYPYSGGFSASLCNGTGTGTPGPGSDTNAAGAEYGYPANGDSGIYRVAVVSDVNTGAVSSLTHTLCAGDGTLQMSGNVAEWEDACDGTEATSNCRVRGGSYAANDDPAKLACNAVRTVARVPMNDADLADVGIRCCLY